MREILFKAKRIDNGEWVVGYYVRGLDMYENEVHLIFEPTTMFYSHGETDGFVEVDQSTICQSTGLKDKNGKFIWENDIVKYDFGEDQIGVQLAIVKYDSKYACYQIKPIYDWMYCDKSDCEVIGNIFDNPELLEVGE